MLPIKFPNLLVDSLIGFSKCFDNAFLNSDRNVAKMYCFDLRYVPGNISMSFASGCSVGVLLRNFCIASVFAH